MRGSRIYENILWLCCLAILFGGSAGASAGEGASVFDQEQIRIKYNMASGPYQKNHTFALSDEFASDEAPAFDAKRGYKSPAKAFVLSLVVPGLGQYYYGSRVKPFVFLGAEVAAWIFHVKYHNQGDDITAEFEAFNRAHWSRDDYEQKYLLWVYGVTDDEDLPVGTRGITHYLPNELTQQYYEMTGKYDQFAWGWDDAEMDGRDLDSYSASDPPDTVIGDATAPYSANRLHYEEMRNDANNAYDKATRMIYVSMVNRLISAFEALFATKKHNREVKRENDEFSRFKVSAKLKSYYAKRDTPFITVTYKF